MRMEVAKARSVTAGQVGEHGERLAEGVVDRVGPAEVAVHRRCRRRARGRTPPGGCSRGPAAACPMARTAPGSWPTSVWGKITPMSMAAVCPPPARRAPPASRVRALAATRPGPSRLRAMKLRIFVEPQQGASYDAAADGGPGGRGASASTPSSAPTTSSTMGGDGLPGPTDSWVTLGAIARETERIRLGTLVTVATFRQPGLLAVAGGAGRRHERRPGRARPRRGLVRRRAQRLRRAVPAHAASAWSGSRSSSPSSPACGARPRARRSASTAATTT